MSNLDSEYIKKILSNIAHLECRGTLLVEGGTLVLYLGEVLCQKPFLTTWRLWIDCAWRLENSDKVIIGSMDEAELVNKEIKNLHGSKLVDIKYDELSKDLALGFDSGFKLKVFTYSVEDEQWELRKSDGYRLTLGSELNFVEKMEKPDSFV